VKRLFGFAVGGLACATAGAFAAVVLAGGVSAAALLTTGSTATTTTGATTTAPLPALIPPGVTISGIPVGGLTPEDATTIVQERFDRPLPVVLDRRHRLAPTPARLGSSARVEEAIERARSSQPGTALTLPVRVDGGVVRAYVLAVSRRFNRSPADAHVFLRRLKPVVVPDRPGLAVNRLKLTQTIVARLRATSRAAVRIRYRSPRASVLRREFRSVIVIRRRSNHLLLYHFDRLRRSFRVATGQSVYPTPLGRFQIQVKWRNPWWYPPNSRWARGQKPIPPGPNNPLGTRWMGLSAPGVGIHGTPNPASIGYSVSHGCIRMYIADAEWLFNVVDIGTTVFIVSA
jgi:lipoprotein-anchoring transpeptidase ErfK/SrfK